MRRWRSIACFLENGCPPTSRGNGAFPGWICPNSTGAGRTHRRAVRLLISLDHHTEPHRISGRCPEKLAGPGRGCLRASFSTFRTTAFARRGPMSFHLGWRPRRAWRSGAARTGAPATKLIPTVLVEVLDRAILAADDDRIYPLFFVERMEVEVGRHPDAKLTFAGIVAPEDLTDRPTTLGRSNLCQRPRPWCAVTGFVIPRPSISCLGCSAVWGDRNISTPVHQCDFHANRARRGSSTTCAAAHSAAADVLVIPARLLSHLLQEEVLPLAARGAWADQSRSWRQCEPAQHGWLLAISPASGRWVGQSGDDGISPGRETASRGDRAPPGRGSGIGAQSPKCPVSEPVRTPGAYGGVLRWRRQQRNDPFRERSRIVGGEKQVASVRTSQRIRISIVGSGDRRCPAARASASTIP